MHVQTPHRKGPIQGLNKGLSAMTQEYQLGMGAGTEPVFLNGSGT